MGRLEEAVELTREDVQGMIDEARTQRKGRASHVRSRVERDFPDLVGKKITRNGRVYDAIDYLMQDIDGYH